MKRQLVPVFAAAFGAALLLGGCSNAAGIKALDRTATAEDALPDNFDAGPAKPDSSRLLTTHDGVKYFVAQGNDAGTTCVAAIAQTASKGSVAGCGPFTSPTDVVSVTSEDRSETKLVRDGFESKKLEAEGWTRIHDNLLVKTK